MQIKLELPSNKKKITFTFYSRLHIHSSIKRVQWVYLASSKKSNEANRDGRKCSVVNENDWFPFNVSQAQEACIMRNWSYFLFEIIPRICVCLMFEYAIELHMHSEWFHNKENNFRFRSNTVFSVSWLGICQLSHLYFRLNHCFRTEHCTCYCYKCQRCADCIRFKSRLDAIFSFIFFMRFNRHESLVWSTWL